MRSPSLGVTLLLAALLPACADSPISPLGPAQGSDDVVAITLSQRSLRAEVGDTVRLHVGARDGRGRVVSASSTSRWRVADPTIAGVEEGLVYFLRPGATTVEASFGGAQATAAVSSVGSTAVRELRFSVGELELAVGDTAAIAAELSFSNDVTLQLRISVRWSSLDPSIVSVENGQLVGRGLGTTRVVATLGELADTVSVTVAPPALLPPPAPGVSVVELPRVYVDTELPPLTGRTLRVRVGQSLQTAIDSARLGDEIVLEPGVTYTGPFVLRRKTAGSGWLVIRSGGTLPAPGTRVRPADAARMPRLVARNAADRVLTAEPGAHHYRLIGLEVTVASPTETAGPTALIEIGVGGSAQNTHAKQPSHIVFDRMYVHGTPVLDFRSCIRLQSAHTAVIDSWIADCHAKGFDSQAISGYNGSGPFKIVNNFLEGAGENVMFGGADSRAEELLPQDIEIRGNHFYKPASWKGRWTVKNLFELKVGKRVLVEGNVFENNWSDGQSGFAINLKSVNQSGRAPWSETSDVTFRYNIVRNSEQGITLHRKPEGQPAVPMSRLLFEHNVFERLGTTGDFGGGGRLFTASGINDLTIRHNTAVSTHSAVVLTGVTMQRLVIAHNVFGKTQYGIVGDGKGYGTRALNNRAAPGWIFEGNVLPGVSVSTNPAGNHYPTATANVGFTDLQNWNLQLRSDSPYRTLGPGHSPLGAHHPQLLDLTRNVTHF